MRAVVKTAPGPGAQLSEKVEDPIPGEGEVVVSVAAASVCGTDAHLFAWSQSAQDFHPKLPLVMGHECSGIIADVGPGVARLAVGDFVAIETHLYCGYCPECRTGDAHNCRNLRLLGLTIDGAFAERVRVPESACFSLPSTVSTDTAALFEPAGVSVHALQRAGSVAGARVLVSGCGPVGLVVVQLCLLFGASTVIATEPNPYRRRLAEHLGAVAVDPQQADAEEQITSLTGERAGGAQIAFETSGSVAAYPLIWRSMARESTLVTVGHPGGEIAIDVARYVNKRGITVKGIFGRRIWGTWEQLLALVESGRLDLSWIITHRFELEAFEEAISVLTQDAAKVIIYPNGVPV